ncbi:helix-turn-helix transcriptional regulator [Alteromonas sp. S015]|uniref:helix-turn-helix transcriptional regulator n=1 Tax=Alteromonas sp. S015 TaxID=3117401 RepID=UPI002FE01342
MRLIRLNEVLHSTGLSRSTVYKYVADNLFPKPVSLGDRAVGWVEQEVNDWLSARLFERDHGLEPLSIRAEELH